MMNCRLFVHSEEKGTQSVSGPGRRNMYHLGITRVICINMYLYDTSMHLLEVNMVQKCTFLNFTTPVTAFVPFLIYLSFYLSIYLSIYLSVPNVHTVCVYIRIDR